MVLVQKHGGIVNQGVAVGYYRSRLTAWLAGDPKAGANEELVDFTRKKSF
jgi:hypothetical protein